MATTIGVVRERAPGERRVALVPEVVERLHGTGLEVLVEPGAGAAAWFDDTSYAQAGATLVPRAEVYRAASVLTCVRPPVEGSDVRTAQTVIGLLEPYGRLEQVRDWARRGVTAVSLDTLPRTLRRARAMDAYASQATFAGYKSAVLAADLYGGFFPSMPGTGGTGRPASVLVLGTGVAGRTAIDTARRLGAVVSAYDSRPKARAELIALGARLLGLPRPTADTPGDRPDELTAAQRDALAEQVRRFDAVITTRQAPGRCPPVLVSAEALGAMRPGSVAVDVACGPYGGNVEGSVPDTTIVTAQGVTVVGAGNLPASMAPAASAAYSRNVAAALNHLLRDGSPVVDPTDEVTANLLITYAGEVVNPGIARLLSEA